jgi:ABC-type branched-subunit amino acid transport system ATPase component
VLRLELAQRLHRGPSKCGGARGAPAIVALHRVLIVLGVVVAVLVGAVAIPELLGVAGLVGAGRSDAVRAVFGADPRSGGRIFRDGREVAIGRPRDAVRAGICLLTEDRKVDRGPSLADVTASGAHPLRVIEHQVGSERRRPVQ